MVLQKVNSILQRELKLGFPRAARIMDEIEEMGIIGPQEGSKARKINITKEEWAEMQARRSLRRKGITWQADLQKRKIRQHRLKRR